MIPLFPYILWVMALSHRRRDFQAPVRGMIQQAAPDSVTKHCQRSGRCGFESHKWRPRGRKTNWLLQQANLC